MGKTAKRIAITTGVAALAGYIAGILTAPKSGKETRDDLKEGANKSIVEAEKELKKLHSELTKFLDETKGKSGDLSDKASKDLEAILDRAKASKEKARNLLSSIHEGEVEDKDLKKAIDEATKAIDHLRDYLKK